MFLLNQSQREATTVHPTDVGPKNFCKNFEPEPWWSSLTKSAATLAMLIAVASHDNQPDLLEKLSLQSSGISHLLDVYSDALFFVFIGAQVLSSIFIANHWAQMTGPLKASYIGIILFMAVATNFHIEPAINVFYLAYFSGCGSFIYLCHAIGLSEFCNDMKVKEAQLQQAKAHFFCLGVLPFILSACGATDAVGRFMFNGYSFVYGSLIMEPMLREAQKGATSKESVMKFKATRILALMEGLALMVESHVAELFEVDMHVLFHVVAYSHVVLMQSILNDSKSLTSYGNKAQ